MGSYDYCKVIRLVSGNLRSARAIRSITFRKRRACFSHRYYSEKSVSNCSGQLQTTQNFVLFSLRCEHGTLSLCHWVHFRKVCTLGIDIFQTDMHAVDVPYIRDVQPYLCP